MAIPADSQFLQIETAAHEGAHGHNPLSTPTEAQHFAGNYKKGRLTWQGLRIAIEQPRGTYRTGRDQGGKRWSTRMAAHYGYFEGVKGADGDELDCFVGFYPQSETVYVVNQNVNGRFDEHKCLIFFPDQDSAERAYRDSYERGWNGLHSIVPASISQLKWWLKNGNKSRPLLPEFLPHEGLETMNLNTPIAWDASAQPVGMNAAVLLYEIRRSDAGAGLLMDAVTRADIMEDADEVMAMDAMVTPYAKVERKLETLRGVMERASAMVKPVALQVTDPFKQRGVVNVAGIFELSDGQTVSVYLHNPDTTPNKLAPTDELISWKWLLNKKDITIVVAPEQGEDLNVREVARRIMKLAEKNSTPFQRANGKRAERMQAIQGLKDEIAGLEVELSAAQRELEVARVEAEGRVAAAAAYDALHYSEKISRLLVEQHGWIAAGQGEAGPHLSKTFAGATASGEVSDGSLTVFAAWDDRARFLTLQSGFDNVFDMDARDQDVQAFASEFNRRVDAWAEGRRAAASKVVAERNPEAGGAVKAKEGLSLQIKDAVEKALQSLAGVVETSDGMKWGISASKLNKMVAATNADGAKPFQRERIMAIQQLQELAKAAGTPKVRPDDGRDENVEAVYEYLTKFEAFGEIRGVRILCKKLKLQNKRQKDSMHSIAMDKAGESPATRIDTDGLLDDLEVLEIEAQGGDGVGSVSERPVPPSVSNGPMLSEGRHDVNKNPGGAPEAAEAPAKPAAPIDPRKLPIEWTEYQRAPAMRLAGSTSGLVAVPARGNKDAATWSIINSATGDVVRKVQKPKFARSQVERDLASLEEQALYGAGGYYAALQQYDKDLKAFEGVETAKLWANAPAIADVAAELQKINGWDVRRAQEAAEDASELWICNYAYAKGSADDTELMQHSNREIWLNGNPIPKELASTSAADVAAWIHVQEAVFTGDEDVVIGELADRYDPETGEVFVSEDDSDFEQQVAGMPREFIRSALLVKSFTEALGGKAIFGDFNHTASAGLFDSSVQQLPFGICAQISDGAGNLRGRADIGANGDVLILAGVTGLSPIKMPGGEEAEASSKDGAILAMLKAAIGSQPATQPQQITQPESREPEMPTPQQDPAKDAARAMMQAIIDGTTDPLMADLDALEAAFTSYQDDAEIAALFERAVDVVMQAEAKATEGV